MADVWQTYVDAHLMATQKLKAAAIIDHYGRQLAASAGFSISAEEANALVQLFNNPDSAYDHGIKLANQKYFAINCSEQLIHGKQGAGGAVCSKTNTTILIGIYDAPVTPGEANIAVEKIGDYLRGVNSLMKDPQIRAIPKYCM